MWLEMNWLFSQVVNVKPESALPLPSHSEMGLDLNNLSYSQYLHYVSQTNYKNLWKEAQKKFPAAYRPSMTKTRLNQKSLPSKEILRMLLNRIYSSPILCLETSSIYHPTGQFQEYTTKSIGIFESASHFFILLENTPFSVHQCLSLSPAILNLNSVKPMYILFQLLHAVKQLQDLSFFVEGILWHHIFIDEMLSIRVLPAVSTSLIPLEPTTIQPPKEAKLEELTMSWVLAKPIIC